MDASTPSQTEFLLCAPFWAHLTQIVTIVAFQFWLNRRRSEQRRASSQWFAAERRTADQRLDARLAALATAVADFRAPRERA